MLFAYPSSCSEYELFHLFELSVNKSISIEQDVFYYIALLC